MVMNRKNPAKSQMLMISGQIKNLCICFETNIEFGKNCYIIKVCEMAQSSINSVRMYNNKHIKGEENYV